MNFIEFARKQQTVIASLNKDFRQCDVIPTLTEKPFDPCEGLENDSRYSH